MRSPEQTLHIAVAQYLGIALRPPTVFTTFPAGGGGHVRGAFLKSMGLRPGMPDLIVFHPHPSFGCIVVGIELKAGKRRLSEHQIDTHAALTLANARVGVCRSIDDVAALLKRHGIPLHALPRALIQIQRAA